jgi:hypothetical protein
MCRRVTCKTCGKTTYAGCGMHIEQVLAGVPASRRCAGHRDEKSARGIMGWLRRR